MAQERDEETPDDAAERERDEGAAGPQPPTAADLGRPDAGHGVPVTAPAAKAKASSFLGILGFVAALGVGFFIGQWWINRDKGDVEITTGPRYKVELRGDEPTMGAADPLITVIQFSDYQCPYCAQADGPLTEAVQDAGDVRLIHKHFPLPGHAKANPAARVAWAALQQGKFWEFHRWLFEHKGVLDDLEAEVAQQGLDSARFLSDMGSEDSRAAVDGDLFAGGKEGVSGTPAFFVNGHRYVGGRTEAQWEQVFEAEREQAEALLAGGVGRAGVYDALMKDALEQAAPRPKRAGDLDPAVAYRVPVTDRPSLGPSDALVTLVVFSDFQCPFCKRLAETMQELVAKHPDVRVVFRNFPMASHARARGAAKAALAAHRQGKFWPMHDALFAAQAELADLDWSTLAGQVGLDVAQFEADLPDPAFEQLIAEDEALARTLHLTGRPSVFVNGHFVRGAQPIAVYEEQITAQRKEAEAVVAGGVARAELYDHLMTKAEATVATEGK